MNYPLQPSLKTLVLAISVFFFSFQASAYDENSNPWRPISESDFGKKEMERTIIPSKFRTFKLDLQALKEKLNEAPLRFSAAAETQDVILHLPMPNGEMERFKIFDAPILGAELAAKFPMMHSYAGVGIDDPTASLRMDVTQFGFHGMILSARHSSVYIDPYSKADTEHYIAYYKNDFKNKDEDFACHLKTGMTDDDAPNFDSNSNVNALLQGDCELRTYTLALSSTGEYSQFHGGTTASVMAAMTTTMTRVNGIFERDVNANMVIVNGNENLIFLDANSDPYDNASASQLINECHSQCDLIIGNSNYDIGHVFSTGGGGLAGLGVVCNSNNKGRGVTGTNNPVGDPFDVDYVAHEIGHQFGANHTFNNSCGGNRNGNTAVEPGSGSSIMAYAGICPPNVQFNSDDYFHAMSIQEMTNHITGSANSCATTTATGNNPPIVDGGSNYVLPISTPFKLTAIGSDTDGNTITYCWEQMNNEIVNMPPEATNTGGPAFRSYDPTEVSFRYFPKLSDIVNGIDDEWEELPSVSRSMDFRVTVRDNHQGSGCTKEDDVNLTFSDSAGPFLVQSPNTSTTWMGGTSQNITWDVANTSAAPVNCANVDILLSTDGGYTYDMTLASQVSNTGSYSINVPNIESATCRVMVVCSDNIFFDISDSNFEINVSNSPTFVLNAAPDVQDVCGSVGSVDYQIDLTGLAGFNEPVTLSTIGLPTNATSIFSENEFVPTAGSALTINNLQEVANGTYNIFVVATSASIVLEKSLTLIINNSAPEIAILNSPASGAIDQNANVTLTWENMPSATGYEVEIAISPLFGNDIIETVSIDNNTFTSQNLTPLTIYYWRVKAMNNCGEGDQSTWFSFQTGGEGCQVFESTDVPIDIPNTVSTIVSTLNVDHALNITSVKPTMDISHSWVGDLKVTLTSPAGTNVELMNQVGVPASQDGCSGDNLNLTFDDGAPSTASDLEVACGAGNYALEGTYQPVQNLSTLNSENAIGNWNLTVQDLVAEDGGALNHWSVEVCFNQTAEEISNLTNETLTVDAGNTKEITHEYLKASTSTSSTADIKYLIVELPMHGSIFNKDVLLNVGSVFTQEDIQEDKITYHNTNVTATTDQFTFNVSTPGGAWIQNEIFNIIISAGAISATSIIEQSISCFGENDGMIFVNATGANTPFTYSLNGVNFQDESLFTNLSAGNYVVTVKDNQGNTLTTNEVELTNPMELNATPNAIGDEVTITASGGTGDLLYNVDGGIFQNNNVFTNLQNGQFTFGIKDANGCQIEVSESVNVIQSAAITSTNVICHNEPSGTITVNSVEGGNSPFLYSIDNANFSSNTEFTQLAPGTYNVFIMDVDGFVKNVGAFTVNNMPNISVTANLTDNTIIAQGIGGNGTLLYSINGVDFQESKIFENLPNGTYVITVMDENGCTETTNEITISITAIQELDFEISFEIFPNPNQGFFTLELNQETEQNLTLQIFDVTGKLVQALQIEKTNAELKLEMDIPNLPAGSYEILLTDGEMYGRKRFVKM